MRHEVTIGWTSHDPILGGCKSTPSGFMLLKRGIRANLMDPLGSNEDLLPSSKKRKEKVKTKDENNSNNNNNLTVNSILL